VSESHAAGVLPELPDVFSLRADAFPHLPAAAVLRHWEFVAFAGIAAGLLSVLAFAASRAPSFIPGKLQNAAESVVEGLDSFVCGILGPQGRRFTPFIGTLFIYIFSMNLLGLLPFMKAATASLSATFALSLCVFAYVQYMAIRTLGIRKYVDHLAGSPRGAMAWTLILPVFMLSLHLLTELLKPLSLALRLRSNIWGDELLLATFANFGILGLPFTVFALGMGLLAALIQALVFSLLSTVYFAIFLNAQESHH
jgi:F-type H+-transporting ATPase subunit a